MICFFQRLRKATWNILETRHLASYLKIVSHVLVIRSRTHSLTVAFHICNVLTCWILPFKFFLHPSQVHWCFSREIIFTFGCRFVGQIQVLFSYNLFLSIFLRVSVSFDDALATSSSLHTDFHNRSNNSHWFCASFHSWLSWHCSCYFCSKVLHICSTCLMISWVLKPWCKLYTVSTTPSVAKAVGISYVYTSYVYIYIHASLMA